MAGQETQLLSRDVALNDISTRNDWVPGDRGYVANTGRGNIHPVEAGENLIYLGNNKFWGHLPAGEQNVLPLKKWEERVEGWNGQSTISAEKWFPKIGLK